VGSNPVAPANDLLNNAIISIAAVFNDVLSADYAWKCQYPFRPAFDSPFQ
jgi:hypothetical protein